MQFYVGSRSGPARRAKQLKRVLAEAGYELRLTQCQRLVAQMMGFGDWQEMNASIGTATPSPGDDFVDDGEFERRTEQPVRVLLEAGVEEVDARMAVGHVGPSAYGGKRVPDSDQEREFLEEWGLRRSGGT